MSPTTQTLARSASALRGCRPVRVAHPRAVSDAGRPPAAVSVRGESVPVDDDGTFDVPDDADAWLDRFADAHGVDPDTLVVTETCGADLSNGDTCGRELPCQYHSDTEA